MNFGLDLTDPLIDPLELLMLMDQLGIPFQSMQGRSFPPQMRKNQMSSFLQNLGHPSRHEGQSQTQHATGGHPSIQGTSGNGGSRPSGGNQHYQMSRPTVGQSKKPKQVFGSMVFRDTQ